MLLNLNRQNEPHKSILTKTAAVVSAGVLFLVLLAAAKGVAELPPGNDFDGEIGLVKNLGIVLFKDLLLPFELSSVIFLSAMVGAVMLSKREKKKA
jgi:NADH-quinone oxidoreductase subunit J